MAIRRTGSVFFMDAPGTYAGLLLGQRWAMSSAILVADPGAPAMLQVFADSTAVATEEVLRLRAPAGETKNIEWFLRFPPGLTIVLSGAGAVAFLRH